MNQPLIKPQRLRKGDTVGVVAPSSPPFEEGHIEYSYKWLEKLGLKCKVSEHVFARHGDFAGSDSVRLDEFHKMWADDSVKAIFPIRGGNGSVRLLPKLDFKLFEEKPKILIGFSDITGLLVSINQKSRLVTFHGPNFGSFYDSEWTYNHYSRALLEADPIGELDYPPGLDGFRPAYPPPGLVIAHGTASGLTTGGSLTLVKQLMGTTFEIETENKIVFLEDVGEDPHSIDRMITQLLLAEKFQKCAGIVFGESVECKPGDSGRRSFAMNYSVEQVLKQRLGSLGIPVVYGYRFGHGRERCTIPLGVAASINTNDDGFVSFKITEAATTG